MLSSEGYRADGRRANELRHITAQLRSTSESYSNGSCIYTQGNTQLQCTINGPYELNTQQKQFKHKSMNVLLDNNSMILDINITIPPYSTAERRQAQPRYDKQSMEYIDICQQVYTQCIDCKQYPDTRLSIDIHVLHNNGSLLSCIINAITVTLLQSCITMNYIVQSVNCTIYNDQVIIDTNSSERQRDNIDVTLVCIPKSYDVISIHYNNGQIIKLNQLTDIIEYCTHAIDTIYGFTKRTINEYNTKLLQGRT